MELLPLLEADEVGLLVLHGFFMILLQLIEDAVRVAMVLPQDWARVDGGIWRRVLDELARVDWLAPRGGVDLVIRLLKMRRLGGFLIVGYVVFEHILGVFVLAVASMLSHVFGPQPGQLVLDHALQLPLAPEGVAELVIVGLVGRKAGGMEVVLVDLPPSGRQLLEIGQDLEACVDAMLGPVVLQARVHEVAGERLLHQELFLLADGLLEPELRFDGLFHLLVHISLLVTQRYD